MGKVPCLASLPTHVSKTQLEHLLSSPCDHTGGLCTPLISVNDAHKLNLGPVWDHYCDLTIIRLTWHARLFCFRYLRSFIHVSPYEES
jgi:hypothetical protein